MAKKKILKKILKFGLYGFCLLIVALIALVIWQWEMVMILLGNQNLEGKVGTVPKVAAKQFEPISKGENDWTCWLGPNGDGSSNMKNIPKDWSKGLKKLWQVDYLCQGKASAVWSAPVIQGNRLVVCGRDNDDDVVFCLNPDTGELIWRSTYPAKAKKSYGSGTRATPWIDDDRVYTYGRSGDLVCWQLLDGKTIWHRNVKDEGGKEPRWGLSNSPLVTDGLVIVNGGGSARTIAYDKLTGEMKWKSGEGKAGYAALRTMTIDGKKVVLSFHGTGLAAIDPVDGRQLWDIPWKTSYDVNATTPTVDGNLVFITSGYGTGCELLNVTAKSADPVWKSKVIASHHSDPFVLEGYIYGYSGQSMQNKGTFKCVELRTGTERWATNEMGWGTGVYVDGHILTMDNKGNLFLMKPDPKAFIKVTSMPEAIGDVKGATWTKPIIANGKLYIRFMQKLACYQLSDK